MGWEGKSDDEYTMATAGGSKMAQQHLAEELGQTDTGALWVRENGGPKVRIGIFKRLKCSFHYFEVCIIQP